MSEALAEAPVAIQSAISALSGTDAPSHEPAPDTAGGTPAPEPTNPSPKPAETPVDKDGGMEKADDANPVKPEEKQEETVPEFTDEERAALVEHLEKLRKDGQPEAPVAAPDDVPPAAQPDPKATETTAPTPLEIPDLTEATDALIDGNAQPMMSVMGGVAQQAAIATINAYNQQLARALPVVVGEMVEIAVATALAQRDNPALEDQHEQLLQAVREARKGNPNASIGKLTQSASERMKSELALASALAKFKNGARIDGRGNPSPSSRPNPRTSPASPANGAPMSPIEKAIARLRGEL